jgi:hypothetical protein
MQYYYIRDLPRITKTKDDLNVVRFLPTKEGIEDWKKQSVKLGAKLIKLNKQKEGQMNPS